MSEVAQVIFRDPTVAIGEFDDIEINKYVIYGILEKDKEYYFITSIFPLTEAKGNKKVTAKIPKGCVESIKYLKEDKSELQF